MATATKKPSPAPTPPPGRRPLGPRRSGVLGVIDAIYRFLASLKLAVISLSTLAAVLAYATFYESWHGTAAVQEHVYQAFWFHLILLGLATNILCAALIRYPWAKRQTGFVITHAGLLVLVFGSWWSFKYADEGTVGMLEGETSSQLVRTDYPVIRVRMGSHDHDAPPAAEYEVPFRPGSFAWKPGRYEVLTTRKDPFQLAVKGFYPASAPRVITVADPSGVPSLKIRPRFTPPGATRPEDVFEEEERWLRIDRRIQRVTRARGSAGPMPAQFAFQYVDRPEMVEDFLNPPKDLGPDGAARIRYRDRDGKARSVEVPIDADGPAKDVELPDSDLSARYVKTVEFSSAEAGLTAMVGPGDIKVAEFEVKRGDGPAVTHYGWAMLPMVPNTIPSQGAGPAAEPLMLLSYYAPPELDAARMRLGFVEVIATPEKALYYRVFGRGEEGGPSVVRASGPLKLDEEIVAFGGDKMPMQITFTAEEYLPAGVEKVIAEPITLPKSQMGNGIPAALVELTVDGQTEDVWIRPGADQLVPMFKHVDLPGDRHFEIALDVDRKPLGFEVTLDDFDVGFDPGTQQASSFVSKVRVTDTEQKVKDRPVTISMNEPMVHRQWTFYQSSYIPVTDPRTGQQTGQFKSVFQVGSDPGRAIKYLGSLMICVGAFVQFYMRAGVFTGMKKDGTRPKGKSATDADEPL